MSQHNAPKARAKSSWRDILPVHPAADALPMLSPEALRELAEDIKANGLREPPVLFEDVDSGTEYLLDGRNRLDALELLGIQPVHREHDPKKITGAWSLTEEAQARIRERGELVWSLPTGHSDKTPWPTDAKTRPIWYSSKTGEGFELFSGRKRPPREGADPVDVVISLNLKRRHLRPAELVEHALAIRAAVGQTLPSGRVSAGGRGHKGEATEIAEQTGVSVQTARRGIAKSRRRAVPNRAPKPEPTEAQLLVKEIDSILGPRATLLNILDRWLLAGPSEAERASVSKALERLSARLDDFKSREVA